MTTTTDPKDQTKRLAAIALLETVIAKNAASIEITELCLKQQIAKQINRLAELRHQQMLLRWQTRNPKSATP